MASISARLAPNSFSVVSPSIASNRWAASTASLRHCAWFSASVPRPMMIMKIGMSGAARMRIRPDTQSVGSTKARIARGTKLVSRRWGR